MFPIQAARATIHTEYNLVIYPNVYIVTQSRSSRIVRLALMAMTPKDGTQDQGQHHPPDQETETDTLAELFVFRVVCMGVGVRIVAVRVG